MRRVPEDLVRRPCAFAAWLSLGVLTSRGDEPYQAVDLTTGPMSSHHGVIESAIHELGHAVCLGDTTIRRNLTNSVSNRISALDDRAATWNEVLTLAIGVVVLRDFQYPGTRRIVYEASDEYFAEGIQSRLVWEAVPTKATRRRADRVHAMLWALVERGQRRVWDSRWIWDRGYGTSKFYQSFFDAWCRDHRRRSRPRQ